MRIVKNVKLNVLKINVFNASLVRNVKNYSIVHRTRKVYSRFAFRSQSLWLLDRYPQMQLEPETKTDSD